MQVRYSPRIARWIAEREQREPNADGSVTLEHPMLDIDWAVRYVLQYGAAAEGVSPRRVREALCRQLARIVASVAAVTSGGSPAPRLGALRPSGEAARL